MKPLGKFDLRCEYKSDDLGHLVRFDIFRGQSANLMKSPFYYVKGERVIDVESDGDFVEVDLITSSEERAIIGLGVYGPEDGEWLPEYTILMTIPLKNLVTYEGSGQ